MHCSSAFFCSFLKNCAAGSFPGGRSHLMARATKGNSDPRSQPVASITSCPHPSFSHSTILKYFAGLSSILDGPTSYLFVSSLVIESRKIRSVTKTIFFLCQFSIGQKLDNCWTIGRKLGEWHREWAAKGSRCDSDKLE